MANGGGGRTGLATGTGALGGAGTGMAIGSLFGGPFGAPIGAGVGAVLGGAMGFIGGQMDEAERKKMEEELAKAEADYDAAQQKFNSTVRQAGNAASEAVKQGMAAKGASDSARTESVVDQAAMQADQSGLIGAEKAEYLREVRQGIEREQAAQSPAVYQQALGGARQEAGMQIQKAGMGLQAAGQKYQTDVAGITGQAPPNYAASVGQAMGAAGQLAMGMKGIQVADAQAKAAQAQADALAAQSRGTGGGTGALPSGRTGGDPLALAVREAQAEYDASFWGDGTEIDLGGETIAERQARGFGEGPVTASDVRDQHRGMRQGIKEGQAALNAPVPAATPTSDVGIQPFLGTPAPTGASEGIFPTGATQAIPALGIEEQYGGIGTEEQYGPGGKPINTSFMGGVYDPAQVLPEWYTNPIELASGGIAGQAGPEVAVLGEEGPELVLNAKQTAQLAQALGQQQEPAKGYAGGGVAGLQAPTATGQGATPAAALGAAPTRAPTAGPTPSGQKEFMDYDELLAYMTEMDSLFSQKRL